MSTGTAAPRNSRWTLGLTAILMSVLYFQGCNKQGIVLTAGPIVPYASVTYFHDDPFQSELAYFSPAFAGANVLLLAIVLFVLPRASPTIDQLVQSRRFQLGAIAAAILFNLVLFEVPVWTWAVWGPISAICDWT